MGKVFNKYTITFLLLPFAFFAQRIDNGASFRDIKDDNYFRVHYDNDYFTATDYYYTQGYNLELTSRDLRKNPLNYIFPKLKNNDDRYGLALEHIGFTPTSIKSDTILRGDRPFSASIMLKSFLISTDTIRKSRLVSSLTLGIIGPGALGYEMQSDIHEWIGDEEPFGWQYQIKNDAIVNYELAHEKQVFNLRDFLAVSTLAKLRLGTANTSLSGGLTAVAGIINLPYTSATRKHNFQLYAYFQSVGAVIGYDASLQGGLFQRNSPYIIRDSDMERLTLQHNFGIVMQLKRLYFEYSRTELSKEFSTGKMHKWGGFRIGFKF